MQQYSPETEDFFRPRPQAEDEKNQRSRGYIVAYSLTKPHIYNIYTTYSDSVVKYISLVFRTEQLSYILFRSFFFALFDNHALF